MAGKSSKLALGCGIGCGAVVLIIIILGVFVFTFVKNLTKDVEKIDQANVMLEDRFGKVADYEMPQGFSEERILVFFDARSAILSKSDRVTSAFASLDSSITVDEDDDKSFWEVIGIINTGVDMIPDVIEYYTNRSTVLLAKDMPLGEYYFYYVTAYFSYNKNSLADGPLFNLFDHNNSNTVTWQDENRQSAEDYVENVKDARKEELAKVINRAFRKILKNSIISSKGQELSTVFSKELRLLEENHDRIPWSDGLPDKLKSIYERMDSKIKATYNGYLNPIELRSIDD